MSSVTQRLCLLSCLALSSQALAQEDVEGAKDHPAVKRYPGTVITNFEQKEFEEFEFPLADDPEKGGDAPVKVKKVEGRYYLADSDYPENTTCTQVIRNYENAFKAAGLTLHKGTQPPMAIGWNEGKWVSAEGRANGKGGQLYILQTCNPGEPTNGRLVVVEASEMAQKVEIDAGAMADEIANTGRIALYGIQFATGKADITPDSAKTLEQIGQLLKNKPDWKLRVEGHTDNVGKAKANLDLSKKRAEAVKAYLVKNHGVAATRLTAEGYGDTKPLAPNTDEAGRAKNRRVELSKP
jgi:outer membrane protein OmpA-like peptidoglycan-associated protein